MINFKWGGVILLPFLLISCTKQPERPLSALEAQGKASYMANCIACHNPDPRLNGSVGPAVAFSSKEVLTAKMVHQSYPPGYKPKRETKLMPNLAMLEKDIPALEAYLNSFKK